MILSRAVSRGALVALVLLQSACSIYSLPGAEPVPVEKEPDYTEVAPPATTPKPSPRPAEPPASAAYGPLLERADDATARGDYEQALALLERAQRIDPDSAQVYLGMARTHAARGDIAQSRATAERGMLYCTSNAECDDLRAYTR